LFWIHEPRSVGASERAGREQAHKEHVCAPGISPLSRAATITPAFSLCFHFRDDAVAIYILAASGMFFRRGIDAAIVIIAVLRGRERTIGPRRKPIAISVLAGTAAVLLFGLAGARIVNPIPADFPACPVRMCGHIGVITIERAERRIAVRPRRPVVAIQVNALHARTPVVYLSVGIVVFAITAEFSGARIHGGVAIIGIREVLVTVAACRPPIAVLVMAVYA